MICRDELDKKEPDLLQSMFEPFHQWLAASTNKNCIVLHYNPVSACIIAENVVAYRPGKLMFLVYVSCRYVVCFINSLVKEIQLMFMKALTQTGYSRKIRIIKSRGKYSFCLHRRGKNEQGTRSGGLFTATVYVIQNTKFWRPVQ